MATESNQAARLIRELREAAGLTQRELAERIDSTQSVISRLESDDYEGHSLSMLYRVAAALGRRIEVRAVDEGPAELSVREKAVAYGEAGLSDAEFERLTDRLVQRFGEQGLRRADVDEAIRWARGGGQREGLMRLRGCLKVGRGSTVDDVRRAREQRGRDIAARS